jgi:transcriptional regulator with XRE-family HTH domain
MPNHTHRQPHPLRHRVARRVRELREARAWSQGDLAERSGLHRTHVSLIERSRCDVGLDSLASLADAFDVPATHLLLDAHGTLLR